MKKPLFRKAPILWAFGFFTLITNTFGAESDPITQKQFSDLQRQNQLLQRQLQDQKQLIDDLNKKVSALQTPPPAPRQEPQPGLKSESSQAASSGGPFSALGKLHLSGEGGVGIFHSQSHGATPNAEFRVDEAKLFIEAPIWKDVYFFSEINITTREDPGGFLQLGELYLDFENLSRLWNRDRQLNLRVGRFDIPFGEEYLWRDAIDNPLISHSISDIWGVDEGVELYGSISKMKYVLAVQNGGHPIARDFDIDKAVVLRVGYDPSTWLHVSGSAMRTGALNTQGDFFSELWFGNGMIGSLGSPSTTTFHANLLEGDVDVRWSQGYLKAAGGYVKYDDNDPSRNNQREVYYYYLEGVQQLTPEFYAAARWSQALARDGFPIVGDGTWGEYFFGEQTRNLWRLSLGLGYRFSPNLLLKADYTFNQGKTVGGESRTHENVVAAELAFKF